MTQGFDHSDVEPSRCRICRRPFHPLELDEDILRNLGACESCAREEEDHEHERRAELEDGYNDDCIADDSTECDCSMCRGAEDRFWREQGAQAGELGDDDVEPEEDRP